MLPARKMRADKKLYNPGSARHAEQPVLVSAKGQHQPSDHKPHVDYGRGCGPYCGAELGTDLGSAAEAFCTNWLVLHQTALYTLSSTPAYQLLLKHQKIGAVALYFMEVS